MTWHFDYHLSASVHQHRWWAGGYDLEIGHFRGATMVVSWWIVAFWPVFTVDECYCREMVIRVCGQHRTLHFYNTDKLVFTIFIKYKFFVTTIIIINIMQQWWNPITAAETLYVHGEKACYQWFPPIVHYSYFPRKRGNTHTFFRGIPRAHSEAATRIKLVIKLLHKQTRYKTCTQYT